jgi:hypothetical protein
VVGWGVMVIRGSGVIRGRRVIRGVGSLIRIGLR